MNWRASQPRQRGRRSRWGRLWALNWESSSISPAGIRKPWIRWKLNGPSLEPFRLCPWCPSSCQEVQWAFKFKLSFSSWWSGRKRCRSLQDSRWSMHQLILEAPEHGSSCIYRDGCCTDCCCKISRPGWLFAVEKSKRNGLRTGISIEVDCWECYFLLLYGMYVVCKLNYK